MFRFRRTLCILDGPAAWREREVRYDGTTMTDFVHADGTWGIYDKRDGVMYAIRLRETGVFVAGKEGIMFGVTETLRERYDGVL